MTTVRRRWHALPFALIASLALSACASNGDVIDEETVDEAEVEVVEEEDTTPQVFVLPRLCRDILPEPAIAKLTSGSIDLLRGPGSGATDGVYLEGQSPQEERGGISCLFGNLEETNTYTVSVAPMTQATRAEVIDGLLAQKLNPGQTLDGALTYWIQGDDVTVPAIYNAVYDDAWYEVLIFPGGRIAYEEAQSLVSQMRSHTTQ
jgi:hypothetical protein